MERHYPATPMRVFGFITQTENLLKWWGPAGTTIEEHDLDFSRLGDWSAVMVGPQGHGARVGGVVQDIDPPNFVELTLGFFMPDGTSGDVSVIRFETRDDGAGGTKLTLIQTGLKAEHIPDMRDKGWNSAPDRLGQLILGN